MLLIPLSSFPSARCGPDQDGVEEPPQLLRELLPTQAKLIVLVAPPPSPLAKRQRAGGTPSCSLNHSASKVFKLINFVGKRLQTLAKYPNAIVKLNHPCPPHNLSQCAERSRTLEVSSSNRG